MGKRVLRFFATIAALAAIGFSTAGCDNNASPGGDNGNGNGNQGNGNQVVITITNIPAWGGNEVFLTLETGSSVHSNWVIHAKGVATVQNEQAVFQMYTVVDGNMTAQRFATAGQFYVVLHDVHCCVVGTFDMVPITTGSQNIAVDNTPPDETWWSC